MTPSSHTPHMADSTLSDNVATLAASLNKLSCAATNALDLLTAAGFAGMRGDTADDLRRALALHIHLVHQFKVKVSTFAGTTTFRTNATTAAGAAEAAAAHQGDTPCGITVLLADPDRQALAAAHRALRIRGPLDDALKQPSLRIAMTSWARKHQRHADTRTDFKSLAANDRD